MRLGSTFKMWTSLVLWLWLSLVSGFRSLTPRPACTRSGMRLKSTTEGAIDAAIVKATDLTGYGLLTTFEGFGVKNMTCAIELQSNFQVKFSGGIQSRSPGTWRVLRYPDDSEYVEMVHPVLPEYLLFFDITEPQILWRGKVDLANKRIVEGEVISKKKRFGLFPYATTLATFEANLYGPDDLTKMPATLVPKLRVKDMFPPENFYGPPDMRRYPNLFNEEFVEWWFQVEDALQQELEPPARPQPFFVPTGEDESSPNGGNNSVDGISGAAAALRSGNSNSNSNRSNNRKGFEKGGRSK